MKKIISLVMLLVSLATANATDWSKVRLTYNNTCNVYKFEIAGTADTCFDYRYVEIADFNAKVISRTYTRTFTVTFPDTGTYYWASSIKNKCGKNDTTMYGTIRVTCMPKKCDWSTLKLQQWNERNYYKWYLSGKVLDDTCVNYMFMVYDDQTKKIDTIQDISGIVEVQFNVKGRYRLYVKVWNKCEKCDTGMVRPIEIVQFPGAGVGYSVNTTDCKKYKFEMTYIKGYPLKDTCMEYYLVFYKGPWMDTMSQKEWDNLTDYQIGMEYDFPDADFLGYTQTRLADFTFKDTGRVLMYAQWWNKCLRQDTFMFRRLDVCKTVTSNTSVLTRPEPKLIGMYDMLGRPVHNARENEVVIYLFSDGTTRKVVKK